MNYLYSIKQTDRSLKLLEYLYKNMKINDKGTIIINNKYLTINNKKIIIHNSKSLVLKRKYKNEYQFLNLIENYHQRRFIIDRFLNINGFHFTKTIRKLNGIKYFYYSIKNSNNKNILTLKSKIDSEKKFIALIMLYYDII